MMRSFSTQYTTAMSSLPPSPSEAELAALQELYSQYVGLYMQYLSGTAPGTQYEHLVPQQQQQEVQEGGQGEVQGVQAPGAGMVMNAGAGPGAVAADAGGDRNRDILDWVGQGGLSRWLLSFHLHLLRSWTSRRRGRKVRRRVREERSRR